jgi:proteasome activator subunit 4
VLPSETIASMATAMKRNARTLTKLCTFAQLYFDPQEIPAMLEEFLPYFSNSFTENSFVVVGLLNLLLPTSPAPEGRKELQPQFYLPTLFHVWSLMNRSRQFDVQFIDILSRLARDTLSSRHVQWSAYGIFTPEQSSTIFTAILRVLEIPVGQSTAAYSSSVDAYTGLAVILDRDQRKHPIAHHIARWIVMSLSPACLEKKDSVLANLEGLIQAVETFFHPSNSGNWTRTLSQLVYYLADFFVMRWNRERSGEMEVPEDRRLNDAVKRRFVLCLREVIFMGIYAKSGTAMNFSLSTLQSLAYLEPNLILPGALQRIYPSMQGLVEVHRTISSIRSLQMLAKIMARNKGYRCHVTTLLGLALPGIDANDLDKTFYTLSFIQAVAYNVPFHDLTKEKINNDSRSEEEDYDMISRGSAMSGTHTPSEHVEDTGVALRWITEQVDRLDREGAAIELNYAEELSDEDEHMILRSSTTELAEFVTSFLGRVFTLLENLPDASRVRSGSPEENVVNTLPATFTPLLASLSPELYDLALNKISHFVTTHVIHQARDAMAFICNALVKINPKKALQRLIPDLVQCIRTEIEFNGAGSSRTTGSEVVPKDRALVWNISLLSMCIVHVGSAVLDFKKELFDIAEFMQQHCRGVPTVHVSNFIHHLLLNVTLTYTLDFSIYEDKDLARGLTANDWGRYTDPQKINIKWHKPSPEEVTFAIALFRKQGSNAIRSLRELISDKSPVKRDGTGRDWSDEVSRNLTLLRLIISGVSVLFDPRWKPDADSDEESEAEGLSEKMDGVSIDDESSDNELTLGDADDEDGRLVFSYPTGYPLEKGSAEYEQVHTMRNVAGQVLHSVHEFLVKYQQDDVQCFNALYNAYRAWFVDVGIERSAHVLDRVTRLLAADIQPYKFSGLRKEYPRPLLVRRANVYHLQRLRHHAVPREKDELQVQMLLDLAESSVSLYTEIRRTAQGAIESAVKCVIGARPLLIPPLLKKLEESVPKNDYPIIKGCMYSLLFGSLAKTIARDWRYTPRLIKVWVDATTADKQSIQKLVTNALYQVMDMGKPLERMVILDEEVVESIAPESLESDEEEEEAVKTKIENRSAFIKRRRNKVEDKKAELCHDLIQGIKSSHWKQAQRTGAIIINLGMKFDTIAPKEMIDLIVNGAIDPHPTLRVLWHGALNGLFSILSARSLCHHDFKKYLLMQEELPDKIYVEVDQDDDDFTETYLQSFASADAKYYVDYDYPGWLVWKDKFPAFLTESAKMDYDDVENGVRAQVGKIMDRHWFSTFFAYMKQEPRDSSMDRFRMGNALMLTHAFDLVFAGVAAASFEDVKDLTQAVYGDGSDKHQHRATSEIMGALLACSSDLSKDKRLMVWEYVFPIVRGIFTDNLTPENSSYWQTFLHMVTQAKDPRRAWPLVDWLASFRLDMNSSAAFKESSKINLLYQTILEAGWHFQLGEPILQDFMKHLDHPYKSVREAMGVTLAAVWRTRYHESYDDVDTLIQAQKIAGPLGVRPYEPSELFTKMLNGTLERLEKWRLERTPGQQTPTPYTQAGKTILLMLDSMLSSYECTTLSPFFPGPLLEQLLHMMDIKEDPELQGLAYHVFRHMPNVPHRAGEDRAFIDALVRIGTEGEAWHQRLRVLICIQIIYFRRLFLIEPAQQRRLFECVSGMLSDSQLEVRLGASTTLAGMVRCSPIDLRNSIVQSLKSRFTDLLIKNPLPRKRASTITNKNKNLAVAAAGEARSTTPTPEQNKLTLTRHSAVLGLGALVSAFPYTSPPPSWLPEVLATLAMRAASDPGVVGKGVKQILSEFKKTRQDTWHIDVKVSFIVPWTKRECCVLK